PEHLRTMPDAAERRVDRTRLGRLRPRIEPVPVADVLGTERRGDVPVRPVHLACNQRVGPDPVGGRGATIVYIAHERRPRRRHDTAAPGVVPENALLPVVAHPDPRPDP